MAEQPERPIERLLRDSGKARVPSGPLRLHPATRRQLQAEVARTYGRQERRRWWASVRWAPKLAWAFGAVLVIGLGAWIVFSDQTARQNLLASNQKAAPPALPTINPAAGLPQDVPATESTTSPANSPAPVDKALMLADQTASLTNDLAGRSTTLARSALAKNTLEQGQSAPEALPSSVPPPSSANGGAEARYGLASRAMPAFKDNSRPEVSQRFVQEEANKLKIAASSKPLPVLVSFQLERAGSEVRVTDRDGSVYTGSFTNAAPPVPPEGSATTAFSQVGATSAEALRAPPQASNARDFFFQVSGTNRTLQQSVVFSGRWSGPTGSFFSAPRKPGISGGLARPGSGAPAQGTLSRIDGRAVVGGSQQVNIQAVSGQP